MFRPRSARLSCGAAACLLLSGCVSPMQQLETAVLDERNELSNWTIPLIEPSQQRGERGDTAARGPSITESSSLADCLKVALSESPAAEAAFWRWRAALERVPQVTALPDPRVSWGYFVNPVETRVGAQRQRAGLSQTLPWFGKLELRGNVAAQAADAEFERFR